MKSENNEPEYFDNETIDLVLEDGSNITCDVIGIFEIEDTQYIALGEPDSDNILFYIYREKGDEIYLDNIQDEDEYKEVVDIFTDLFDEYFEE